MLFIKKLFDFYIKSSFHLGVCVVSLYIISIYKLQIDLNYYILTCLFSSTIVVYNFIKYASTLPYYFFVQNAPIKKIQTVSFFFGFFLLYSLFFLSVEALFFGFFLFLISGTVGAISTFSVVNIVVVIFGNNVYLAKAMAVMSSFLIVFLFRKFIVFT